jgi:hypothetical protein
MSQTSKKSTRLLENYDIVDIYNSTSNTSLTTGFKNSTGDYVIAKGSDLSIPYMTVQNDGTVVVNNDFVVKGSRTIANSFNVNVDSPLLSVGLGNPVPIKSVTQISNYKNQALVLLDDTGTPLLSNNLLYSTPIYVEGVNGVSVNTSGVTGPTIDYNHKYAPSKANNLVDSSIIPNSNNITDTLTNMSINSSSPLFNYTNLMKYKILNLNTLYQIRIGSCLSSTYTGTSTSTSIDVMNTKGFETSGSLLIRSGTQFGVLHGAVPSNEYQTGINIAFSIEPTASDLNKFKNSYIAGEDANLNVFVLGKLLNEIPTHSTIDGVSVYIFKFSNKVKTTLKSASKFYLLDQVTYNGITNNSFLNISPTTSLNGLTQDLIKTNNLPRMQIYNLDSISQSDSFYFTDFSVNAGTSVINYYISTVNNDVNHYSTPSFDNSPPDLKIQLADSFILTFTDTLPFTDTVTFTSIGAVFGSINTNHYNGMYGTKFHFMNSSNEDQSKSILCGSGNSGSDTLYLSKTVTDNNGISTEQTHFTFDYENDLLKFANRATIKNKYDNQLEITSDNIQITSSNTNQSGNMVIGGTLGITGNTTVGGVLKSLNNFNVNDKFTVNSSNGDTLIKGILGVTGDTNIRGNTVINGTLGVTGNSVLGGTLGVTGNTTVGGILKSLGNFNVNDKFTVNSTNGNTIINGTLGVTGNTDISGVLKVTQSTTLQSSLGVTGNTTIGGTLTSLNNFNVNDKFSVNSTNGNTIINGTLGVTGNSVLGGTLGVTGNTTIGGTLTALNDFNVNNNFKVNNATGNTIINGTLGVTGNSVLGGTLNVSGNTTVNGTLTSLNDFNVNNNFKVNNASGNTVINGTLGVTGNSVLGGTLGVTGNTTIGGTLTALNNFNVNDNFKVNNATGNTIINGTLGITGNTTIGGIVHITNNTQLTDTTNWQSGSAFRVDGDVGIGGDIISQGQGYFNGGAFSISDQSLKTDIIEIDNALEKVNNMRGVYFNWIDKEKYNDKHQAGLIAQEVESVIPELVNISSNGIRSVNYAQLVSVLIQAMKEQNVVINQLKADVDILKAKKTRKPKIILTDV